MTGEEFAAKFREETAKEAEGTIDSLRRSANMIDTYLCEMYPANEQGQVHFVRAVIESVSDEIKAYVRNIKANALFQRAPEVIECLELLFAASLNEMTARNLPHEWSSDSPMAKAKALIEAVKEPNDGK